MDQEKETDNREVVTNAKTSVGMTWNVKRNNRIEDSMDEDSLETIEVTTCPYCGAKLMIFDSKTKICGNCRKKL